MARIGSFLQDTHSCFNAVLGLSVGLGYHCEVLMCSNWYYAASYGRCRSDTVLKPISFQVTLHFVNNLSGRLRRQFIQLEEIRITRFFLLLWFVPIENAAPSDKLCNLLVDAGPEEGFFSSPETPLNAQVTGMYFISYALSKSRWYCNSLTLEHNTILYRQFFSKREIVQ